MHRLILLAMLAVASCAAAPKSAGFRAASAPIYSNASFALSRLQGDWVQVAAFAADGPGCVPGNAVFAPTVSGGVIGTANLCVGGVMRSWSGPVTAAGPGRFIVGEGEAWWVLWDDADNRTLVIGAQSGDFGFVLNKGGPISSDRMVAARQILDFNGYDLDKLTTY
jgi:apolipoprotein D and lipocalin family protein